VAGVRPGLRCAPVLLRTQARRAELRHHGVRHCALASRRALDLAEAHEVADEALALVARRTLRDRGGQAEKRRPARSTGASSTTRSGGSTGSASSGARPPARARAALTNSRNRGGG